MRPEGKLRKVLCINLHPIAFIKLILPLLMFSSPYLIEASDVEIEKDLQKSLDKSLSLIQKAKEKLEKGLPATTEIRELKTLSEDIKASHLLLQEKFSLREESIKDIGTKAIERHRGMSEGYRKALEEYLNLIESLQPSAQQTPPFTSPLDKGGLRGVIENLKSLLDKVLHKKKKPIFGSLPYKHLNYPSTEPNANPSIKSAYKGGNKVVSPDDLKDTAEAPLSMEIATLAQSLNWNPISMYEYVKNNIETEWYWGCMKGAEETLRQKSGNDCDQATLLTALFRASGFPSRYVRGTMEFFAGSGAPIDKIKNLTGIDDPWKIADFFQKAGIPYKPILAGTKITNFQLEHIWVESQIPYANYRGAIIDQHGKTWLGLDTSIKVLGYQYNNPIDIFQQSTINDQLSAIRDEYLNALQTQTPLEYLEAKLSALGYQLSDLMRTRTLPPEIMNILPASMQFSEIKITNEYTEIPDELMHRIHFVAKDINNIELLNYQLRTMNLSNQQIAISYEPETVEDQAIIDSYGGLDNTPAYLVRLRPVLKVNGERVVVGKDGLPMGADYNMTIELYSPSVNEGATPAEKITNTMITGNLSIIGITSQRAVASGFTPDGEKDAEQLLYKEALNYINRWNQAEEELASLFHLAMTRPLPTVVTIGGVIDVTYLLDTPHGFAWKGVFVDADLKTIETVQSSQYTVQSERQKIFMDLSGLQGSVLEHKIFEDDWQVEFISTAKMMQLANTMQPAPEIMTIDKANINDILSTLPFDDGIKEDISNAVNLNLTVKIPNQEITYKDWAGTGYIKENIETGEAGYMLSGMIAGGENTESPEKWVNQYLAQTLGKPYTGPPSKGPAAKIIKIPVTDGLTGTAGKPLSQPLAVMVLDKKGIPVQGAKVTFKVIAGGGNFGTSAGGTLTYTCEVFTEKNGIAKSKTFTLGKKTSDNPTYWWESGYKYYQQVGMNEIDASLDSGISASSPFYEYGLPGDPHHMTKTHGDGTLWAILSFAGFVSIVIEDINNNPIANLPVSFEALNAKHNDAPPNCNNPYSDTRQALLTTTDDPCVKNSPIYGECPNEDPNKCECPKAKSRIDIKTTTQGTAIAEVILGGTPDAIYPITATCTDSKCTATTGNPATFNLYSYYHDDCDEGDAPKTQLFATYVYSADSYGNNINAGKTGATIPVQARLTYLKEGSKEEERTYQCKDDFRTWTLSCTEIVGTRAYTINTNFKTSEATFSGIVGTPQGDGTTGIFTSKYTLASGINEILIKGKGTIVDRRSHNSCAGCKIEDNDTITLNEATSIMKIYGVDIKIDQPPIILIDENGYAKDYYDITYTINPSEYQPLTAYMFLYKENDPDPWWFVANTQNGSGKTTISKGFPFDVNSKYEAEIVLNYGTGVEIRSGRVKLSIVKVEFSRAPTEDASGNKYGYDEMTTEKGDDHVSVKKNDLTYVMVKLFGVSDASNIIFKSEDESIVKVETPALTPAPGFLLKLSGQNKDKAETKVCARTGSDTGTVGSCINVNVYKEIELKSKYYKVFKAGDLSTMPSAIPPGDIASKANYFLKFLVAGIEIYDPIEKEIDFDLNGNGRVDYYNNGSNPELEKIINELKNAGVGFTDIVLLKDSFLDNWYISYSVLAGATTVRVPVSAEGLVVKERLYRIGKPDGSDSETFIIVSIVGNVLTIDTDYPNNQGFKKNHTITSDPMTSHTIVDAGYSVAGLSSHKRSGRPALVVGATADKVGKLAAHEQMHGADLSDVDDLTNVMHWNTDSNPTILPFRYLELQPVKTGKPEPDTTKNPENQWETANRK